MSDKTNNQRAAILARCSSEANVCSQILELKNYAIGRYTVEQEDIYGDNISGSSTIAERPELNRLMQTILEGKKQYSVVLVQDATRLGKSTEQVQEIIDWFSQRKISILFQQS